MSGRFLGEELAESRHRSFLQDRRGARNRPQATLAARWRWRLSESRGSADAKAREPMAVLVPPPSSRCLHTEFSHAGDDVVHRTNQPMVIRRPVRNHTPAAATCPAGAVAAARPPVAAPPRRPAPEVV